MRGIFFALAFLIPGTLCADTLTLAWDPVDDSTLTGYRVYVGTSSRSYAQEFDVGNTTTFSFTQAVPGERYYFAVASYAAGPLVGSLSTEVSAYSNQYPVLQNPGNKSSALGTSLSLQLVGSDPDGKPVSYNASGLPPGLMLTMSTGFITGTPTTAGTYVVTASASDGVLASTVTFIWTISGTSHATPDTTPPKVVVTSPFSTSSLYETNAPTLTLAGTATDNVSVTSVKWMTDRGTEGTAIGTGNWTALLTLEPGLTTATVRAQDLAGNAGSAIVNLIYVVAPTPVSPIGGTTTMHPTFLWNASPLATRYVLQINTSTLPVQRFTVGAAEAGCANTPLCSFTPALRLPPGSYSWQVDATVMTDLGAWSNSIAFDVVQ